LQQYRLTVSREEVPEIFVCGSRNPYGFVFKTANGQLIVAGVEQNTVGEIDRVVLGGNWAMPDATSSFNRVTARAGLRIRGVRRKK
jgi:hypothetical protein